MFQPGEEGWHGARFMLDDGLLGGAGFDRPLPDAAFALHIMPTAQARHRRRGAPARCSPRRTS